MLRIFDTRRLRQWLTHAAACLEFYGYTASPQSEKDGQREAVVNDVFEFVGEDAPRDDLTVIVVRVC